jgi:serine/threonine protein kinase
LTFKYHCAALLAGGFATVYRAQLRNAATGGFSTVAVKVLRPAHLLRPMHLRRFLQEVAVQHAVCHPNVVKVGRCLLTAACCLRMSCCFMLVVGCRYWLWRGAARGVPNDWTPHMPQQR